MNKILQLINDNQHIKQPINVIKNEGEASLYIYDVIDSYYGVNAKDVTNALNTVKGADVLNVYINSAGGSVFEAKAIMALLQRFEGKKVAFIDSLCASAATSIALSCDEIAMTEGAFFMIHNASMLAYGDKQQLRDSADLVEKVEGSIVNDYMEKTGKPEDEIRALMDAETWMTAQEALDNGFIDRISPAPTAKVKNAWNLSAFEKAPEALKQTEPEQKPESQPVGTSTTNANRLKLATSL